MKKNLFCMFLLLCAVSFFPSCSDDDTPPPMVGTEYDGVYKGTLDVVAPSLEIDVKDIPQKIYITKVGDNLFKLQLKNFSFQTFELGTIELSDLKVVKNNEFSTFSGSDELALTVGTCDVSVEGTISGEKTKIDIDVKVLDGTFKDLEVSVKFSGDKLAVDQSSEALVTSFVVNTDPTTAAVIDGKNIILTLSDTLTDFTFTPTIQVSTGAKVTPESGKSQNFGTSTPVKYTVVSEDGIVKTEYTVSLVKKGVYNMEEWVFDETYKFYTPIGTFGSTNGGSSLVYSSLEGIQTEHPDVVMPPYCVTQTEDAKVGMKAACLQTVDLVQAKADLKKYGGFIGALMAKMCPNITAGSLFLGSFILDDIQNPLNCTKFGVPYSAKPVTFTGWYKYTPGEIFRDDKNNVIEGRVDECAIYAVLYEAKDEEGNDIVLTGDNVNKSTQVILRAELTDRTKKEDWTRFELDFAPMNDKTYDVTKEYKLAFICTSSKDGDTYFGAPGSTLYLDELEIISE